MIWDDTVTFLSFPSTRLLIMGLDVMYFATNNYSFQSFQLAMEIHENLFQLTEQVIRPSIVFHFVKVGESICDLGDVVVNV